MGLRWDPAGASPRLTALSGRVFQRNRSESDISSDLIGTEIGGTTTRSPQDSTPSIADWPRTAVLRVVLNVSSRTVQDCWPSGTIVSSIKKGCNAARSHKRQRQEQRKKVSCLYLKNGVHGPI